MTTYHDTLNRAAALLESSSVAWTTGSNARDKGGDPVKANDPLACSWCAIGALQKVAFNDAELHKAAEVVKKAVGPRIHDWNDALDSKDKVVAMFRKLGAK